MVTQKAITTKKSFSVVDAHDLDQRIPKNLMITMEGKPFVLKAGLEWKANQLFGVGNWSLTTEIVNYDYAKKYALVKAAVKFNGQVFENFGEANTENVPNARMHKYILHMAVTRAEARALRVATACGFTAVEEMDNDTALNASMPEQPKASPVEQGQVVTTITDTKCTCGAPSTSKFHDRKCPMFQEVI